MPKKIYLQRIHHNKCYMPLGIKSKETEILWKREWLLSTIND